MLRLFAIQFFYVTLLVLNLRAIAKGYIVWAGLSDLVIFAASFYTIKLVVVSAPTDAIGYALGGAAGSMMGMWISKHWKDK